MRVTERVPKIAIAGVAIAAPAVLAYLAYSRPGYFTSNRNLGGLVLLEILIAAMCMYRRVFFPVVMVCFLLAGLNLPVGTGWAAARWVVLSVGAVVGVLIMVRERHFNVGFFHLVAFFAVLTSLISAAREPLFSRISGWLRSICSGERHPLCPRNRGHGQPQFSRCKHGSRCRAGSALGRATR